MKTYKELQAEIENLQKQAEQARQLELAEAIADIRSKMQEYGITGADLSTGLKKQSTKTPTTVKPKYRNPATGETWSGRGKPPKWIAGKGKEQFLIEDNL